MRLVIDTNTLISGSLWGGHPAQLIDAIKAGKVTLVQTAQLWVEFVEVLYLQHHADWQFARSPPAEICGCATMGAALRSKPFPYQRIFPLLLANVGTKSVRLEEIALAKARAWCFGRSW